VIGTVIFFITNPYFITKPDEKAESESSEIIKQIDETTVLLLYILSFFIPLAGFIVGAIYASKDEEHYKHVGKNCLIFSVLNIILGFIMIVAILGSM
jgi:positive regulator of sigma E activity